MNRAFEKIRELLKYASYWTESTYDEDGYSNDDSEEVVDLDKALLIINQVEEEYSEHDAMDRCKMRGCNKCDMYRRRCDEIKKLFMPIKQTNADRIRSMSDEELAEWLIENNIRCGCFAYKKCNANVMSDCKSTILEWLQSKVEE